MALERTYTVPLRSAFLRAPNYCRTPRAVRALRAFLARHMKTPEEKVRIGLHLNNYVWSRGIRNPPHKVRITATKDDEGIVKAELVGKVFEESPAQEPLPGKVREDEDGHEHEGHDHAGRAHEHVHEHEEAGSEDKIKEELERLEKETRELEGKKAPVKKEVAPLAERKEAPIMEKKAAPPAGKKESPEKKSGSKQQTLAEAKKE